MVDAAGLDGLDLPDEVVAELKVLREEVGLLRHELGAAPERIRGLEQRVAGLEADLDAARVRNGRLTSALRDARDQLVALREEVERLSAPPRSFATFVGPGEAPATAVVVSAGRKLEVGVGPNVDVAMLEPGQEVRLNEALNVVEAGGIEDRGALMTVAELLDDGRVLVVGQGEERRVVHRAPRLSGAGLRAGDSVLVDARADVATERVERSEVDRLVLEQVPDVTYDRIGGLARQVAAIRDAIELPYLHPELYERYELRAPKGILLYGPPGCGKTMIAKAVANALAERVRERTGRDDVRSHFLNVKGPELLDKYVGETERQIRLIFQRAREKASEGVPVIVFFDEMEALFRTRGSGVSSDVETTIVPQLLAEIDGVERLSGVIVIGASNREDMIDPAIMRPGRLDVKIKVDRPDAAAARDILGLYLHAGLPLDEAVLAGADGDRDRAVARLIDHAVTLVHRADASTEFLEVTYAGGDRETLHFRDFSSGAMLEAIVGRAKRSALKRSVEGGAPGIGTADLDDAIAEEFRENEDLPNATNPDDWARISGRKGERIVYVRTLSGGGSVSGRSIETLTPGQYL